MGWGTKIVLLYVGFISMIISLVVLTYQEKVDLVTKNYYEEELRYQETIDGINNLRTEGLELSVSPTENGVFVKYPENMNKFFTSGRINVFRPSDSSLDFEVPMTTGTDNSQTIAANQLKKGLYKIKFTWTDGSRNFYHEDSFFFSN
jgi:hypothetical protein